MPVGIHPPRRIFQRVAYDYLAESRRLLEDGLPAGPVRLSRRHRFAPLAVDVDGDVAATRLVRRGVGFFWDDIHVLTRDRAGGWQVRGGGSGGSGEPWSTEAFAQARVVLAGGAIVDEGGAAVNVPPWVETAALLLGPDVAAVRVDDRRELAVPAHGRVVVVWASGRSPVVSAVGADGSRLGARKLNSHGEP